MSENFTIATLGIQIIPVLMLPALFAPQILDAALLRDPKNPTHPSPKHKTAIGAAITLGAVLEFLLLFGVVFRWDVFADIPAAHDRWLVKVPIAALCVLVGVLVAAGPSGRIVYIHFFKAPGPEGYQEQDTYEEEHQGERRRIRGQRTLHKRSGRRAAR